MDLNNEKISRDIVLAEKDIKNFESQIHDVKIRNREHEQSIKDLDLKI